MEKVGILYHPKVEATLNKAKELEEFIGSKGIPVWLCSAWERQQACDLLNGTDLVLTGGGDGTILRAVLAVMPATTGAVMGHSGGAPARAQAWHSSGEILSWVMSQM